MQLDKGQRIMIDRELLVKIATYHPMIGATIINQRLELADKTWVLNESGIHVECGCAKKCKNNIKTILPELPEHIEEQLLKEIRKFGREF